ncbi:MAG: hypothetical protein KC609_23895, partial [Myxococcales bacterium]|nr:hypothetical protein [Myxococcales bacterium]
MPVHHRFQRALLGACFISSCCLGACDEKAAKATHRTIESTSRRTPKRPPETPPENTPSIVPADTIVARGKRPTEPAVLAFATSRYVIAWRAEPIAGRSSIRLRIGEIGVKRL